MLLYTNGGSLDMTTQTLLIPVHFGKELFWQFNMQIAKYINIESLSGTFKHVSLTF